MKTPIYTGLAAVHEFRLQLDGPTHEEREIRWLQDETDRLWDRLRDERVSGERLQHELMRAHDRALQNASALMGLDSNYDELRRNLARWRLACFALGGVALSPIVAAAFRALT